MKSVCAVLLVFSGMVSGLPNCSNVVDNICHGCDPGYYKLWKFCYSYCPTGWENNDSTMHCDKIDPNDDVRMVFDLKFKDITDYSATAVDSFSTPDGSAFRASQNNPIPTQERGFYFKSTSSLVCDEPYTYLYDHKLIFFVRPKSGGMFLEANDDSQTHLSVEFDGTDWHYRVKTLRTSDSVYLDKEATLSQDLGSWNKIRLGLWNAGIENGFKLLSKRNHEPEITITVEDHWLMSRADISTLKWYVGGGFTGFVYRIYFANKFKCVRVLGC